MRNLAITIRFVGTNYHGFQVQQNAMSVCEAFQDAAQQVLGERGELKGCSRTDSGVHANRYILSLKTSSTIDCRGFIFAMNTKLPDDIAVLDCREADDDFHARYSCKGKRYLYKIYNSRLPDPFLEHRAYRCPVPLDAGLMNEAAKCFIGTHDFSAFCALDNYNRDKSKVRTIFDCSVRRDGDVITISVTGDGFLYNMVRIVCGTLVHVSRGKIPLDTLPAIIEEGDRTKSGPTLPPQGLYLDDIFYDQIILSNTD